MQIQTLHGGHMVCKCDLSVFDPWNLAYWGLTIVALRISQVQCLILEHPASLMAAVNEPMRIRTQALHGPRHPQSQAPSDLLAC